MCICESKHRGENKQALVVFFFKLFQNEKKKSYETNPRLNLILSHNSFMQLHVYWLHFLFVYILFLVF